MGLGTTHHHRRVLGPMDRHDRCAMATWRGLSMRFNIIDALIVVSIIGIILVLMYSNI